MFKFSQVYFTKRDKVETFVDRLVQRGGISGEFRKGFSSRAEMKTKL